MGFVRTGAVAMAAGLTIGAGVEFLSAKERASVASCAAELGRSAATVVEIPQACLPFRETFPSKLVVRRGPVHEGDKREVEASYTAPSQSEFLSNHTQQEAPFGIPLSLALGFMTMAGVFTAIRDCQTIPRGLPDALREPLYP